MRTKLNKLYLEIFSLFAIIGCGQKEVIVTPPKQIYLQLPEEYLADCDVTPPPKVTDYAKLNYRDKERVLTQFSMANLSNLLNCNLRLSSAREYRRRQITIFNEVADGQPNTPVARPEHEGRRHQSQ